MTTHPCTLEDAVRLIGAAIVSPDVFKRVESAAARLIAERDEECRLQSRSGSSLGSSSVSGSQPSPQSNDATGHGATSVGQTSDPPPDVWGLMREAESLFGGDRSIGMVVLSDGSRANITIDNLLTAHDADVAECTRLRAEVERLGKMGWHCRWCRNVFADEDAIDAHVRTCASNQMVKEIADKKAQIEERDASLHLIRLRLNDERRRADENWKGFEKREEECATLRAALDDERKHSNSARMFVAHGAIHGFCGANAPQYNYALQWVNDHDARRAKEKNDGQ